jgi:hypothetical protein
VELTNEMKIAVIQERIAGLEKEKYGLSLDHEVQVFLGTNPKRAAEIEEGVKNCIKAIKMLAAKVAELRAPAHEYVNGQEPAVEIA